MNRKLYKEHYQFEWDYQSKLMSAINIPIGAATVLGGATLMMAQNYPYASSLVDYIFTIIISLAAICIALTIYFIFKAHTGYKYQIIPTPMVLKAYYDRLLKWHEEYGDGEEGANKKFENYLDLRLAQATEFNANNNSLKSAYLRRCSTSLAAAVAFLAAASVPFLINTIDHEEKIYSVKVIPTPENEHRK